MRIRTQREHTPISAAIQLIAIIFLSALALMGIAETFLSGGHEASAIHHHNQQLAYFLESK